VLFVSQSRSAHYVSPWLSYLPSRWVQNSFFFTDRYLYRGHFQAVFNEVNNVRFGQMAFSRAQRALTTHLTSGDAAIFYGLFPQHRPEIDDALIWGLILDKANDRLVVNRIATSAFSTTMHEVNTMQSTIGAAPSPSNVNVPLTLTVAGIGLVGMFCARRYLSSRFTSSAIVNVAQGRILVPWPLWRALPTQGYGDALIPKLVTGWLTNAVLVPVVEESIKKIMSLSLCISPINLGYWFGVNEFINYVTILYSCPPYGSLSFLLLARLAALWMHTTTVRMPYWKAVMFHGFWNAVVSPLIMTAADLWFGYCEDVLLGRAFNKAWYAKLLALDRDWET